MAAVAADSSHLRRPHDTEATMRPAIRRAALAGQGLVEYALIILLVAIALVAALGTFGSALNTFYQTAAGVFPGS